MPSLLSTSKFNSLLALAQSVIQLPGKEKLCWGFDTFEGLPVAHWTSSEIHKPGEFSNTSYEILFNTLPTNCKLVKGLFPDSAVYIDDRFCFAHVDFDFEEGTREAIKWLLPRMLPGGIIVFDDYRWPNCPGVEVAITSMGLTVKESTQFQCYHVC